MKKISLLSLVIALLTCSLQAQTPEKKSTSIFTKITAAWCYPCGTWGKELAEEVRDQVTNKALFISLYNSTSESWENSELYNVTAKTLADQLQTDQGWPSFGVIGIDKSDAHTDDSFVVDVPAIESDCIATINTFATTIPAVSAASLVTTDGNTINVNTKVKFWSSVSGEYYIAAYLIEDGAMHIQNNDDDLMAPVPHHGLLRASMSAGSAWGAQIANGTVSANQTYEQSFSYTVSDDTWDKTKFKVYNIIWKKEGDDYKFINANAGTTGTTGIVSPAAADAVMVYPNPVSERLHISVDAKEASSATVSILDITGFRQYSVTTMLRQGKSNHTLNTALLAPGLYFLHIQTANSLVRKKFVKK
jgi:hypothetical protein